MGRGKIEIKRIENLSNRQVTYSKRRNGLMKKAKEIAVLCDARLSLVIFAPSGKMHEYCSHPNNFAEMLDQYQKLTGKRLWDAKHENLSNEIDRIKKENERMQVELRHMKAEDITSLHFRELMAIEDALQNGLENIRDKKNEIYKRKIKNEEILEEENLHLNCVLQQQQQEMTSAMEVNGRDQIENGYHHQAVMDFQSQMPFGFRVQPMQPNLQDI
ncbi:hypothetical protein LguiA_018244 [Lonicera macranthoides]